jgi:hypothetical protein
MDSNFFQVTMPLLLSFEVNQDCPIILRRPRQSIFWHSFRPRTTILLSHSSVGKTRQSWSVPSDTPDKGPVILKLFSATSDPDLFPFHNVASHAAKHHLRSPNETNGVDALQNHHNIPLHQNLHPIIAQRHEIREHFPIIPFKHVLFSSISTSHSTTLQLLNG